MNVDKTLTANGKQPGQAILLAAASALTAAFLFSPAALVAQAGGGVQQEINPRESLKQSTTDQEIQLMRQDIRAQRRQIVAANLPLSTEESAKFWPVYDQYIGETIKINDGRYALVKDYAANYSTMTDAKAADFIRKWIESDKSMIDLRLKYVPIVEKVLSMKKSAMFFQIDRRAQLMIDLQLASQIPLISPQ
jgi:hypothetical protein